jgi:acetyl esterase/lipase
MDIERVHPELRAGIRRIPALPLHWPGVLPVLRFATRLARSRPPAGVAVEDRRVGEACVRIYRPGAAPPRPALLWIHGGGYLFGTARQDDRRCFRYASQLGLVVVSVDYRLAPEHPFPAALDDCLAAWRWLHASATELGVDPARTAVAGESAGGGLAATLAQRLHDLGGVQPAAQVLVCPMLDDRTAARSELDPIKHRVWNNRANRTGWTAYLGQPPGAPTAPEYAVGARRLDLAGLPPAWIGVGDIDLFCDEDRAYAERLGAAGVPCELDVVPMAPHGFESIVPAAPVSRDFERRLEAFLQRHLEG